MTNRILFFLFLVLLIQCETSTGFFPFLIEQANHSIPLRGLSAELIAEITGSHFKNKVAIEIGTPPQRFFLKMSSSFCGVWVHQHQFFNIGFDSRKSSTYAHSEGKVHMEHVSGTLSHDRAIFIQHSITSMPFLLVDEDSKANNANYQGMIGLGYRCSYNKYISYDILRYITVDTAPIKNVFFVRLLQSGGYIELGNYPSKTDYNYRNYKTMKVVNGLSSPNWVVKLDSVYFDNGEMIIVKDNLTIGLSGAFINVKRDFFLKVKEKYFDDFFHQNLCQFRDQRVYEITCDTKVNPKLGVISFVVGKWNFKVEEEMLFVNMNRNGTLVKWLGIVHYPEYDEYFISQAVLMKRTLVYDKTKDEIGYFHSVEEE